MRFCPVCQTKYDEEIIKFCTKDGTPLVTENPSFTAMPSESSIDDIGEITLISGYKPNIPPPIPETEEPEEPAQRIVIPTSEEKKQEVRPLDKPNHQQQPPPKSNLPLVVFLTIFGTLVVLGGGIGIWLFLRSQNSTAENSNKNTNINVAVNTNYNANFSPIIVNTNTNTNANVNTNTNVNTKTPTPTPTKTPTPTPSPTVDQNLNINTNTIVNISPSNTNNSNNSKPANTATPTPKPSTTPTTPTPQNVNVGVMNSRATSLPKPAYPPIAKQMNASGEVTVQVSIDEEGNVLAAKAVSGPFVLRAPAESAARQSRFNPVKVGDRIVRANGILVYNFINQ